MVFSLEAEVKRRRSVVPSVLGVVPPQERVVPQHFGQFLVKWLVEVSQDLLGNGQHGSQVLVCRPPGVGGGTSGDLRFNFFRQRACWAKILGINTALNVQSNTLLGD